MSDYFFEDDGRTFVLKNLHLIKSADADLWNEKIIIRIDHKGNVTRCGFLQPNFTEYSEKLRCFYIKVNDNQVYSIPYEPICNDFDEFEFRVSLSKIEWKIAKHNILSLIKLFIPLDETVECWEITFENLRDNTDIIDLYTYFPVGIRGLLAQKAYFSSKLKCGIVDYFPYYVKYQDLDRLMSLKNMVFCAPEILPDDYELSIGEFCGKRSLYNPDGLFKKRLSSPGAMYRAANERAAFIYHYRLKVKYGNRITLRFIFGPADSLIEISRLKKKLLGREKFEAIEKVWSDFLTKNSGVIRVYTPDREFDAYVNWWLPRYALMLGMCMRHNLAPQGRNVIQDSMGASLVSPDISRERFLRIWSFQHTDGWLPHGMPFVEGVDQIPINTIPHKDINSWGPTALKFYCFETGDFDILKEKVKFADVPSKSDTLYRHICLGLDWLIHDTTSRGLSRIGQGDWNDPLNMAGIKEKGESIWLSEALAFALLEWADIAEIIKDYKTARYFRKYYRRISFAINKYGWDGRWYRRGFTDSGKPFGSFRNREGKIYLNSQSWAIISGVADEDKMNRSIEAVKRYLMTDCGPMLLWPSYKSFNREIGKLTQKVPGWNENGSVYSHAAVFYGYALFKCGKYDDGFRILRNLLPGGPLNHIEKCGQIPTYIPNFYRGIDADTNSGLSSHNPETGTVAWYYRTVVEYLFGVFPDADGNISPSPRLPSHWKSVWIARRIRGKIKEFEIVRKGSEYLIR